MSNVATKDLTPGMRTATEVRSANGDVILPAGTILTLDYINTLTMQTINEIEIVDEKKKLDIANLVVELDQHLEVMTQVQRKMQKRFVLADLGSAFMRDLYNTVVEMQVADRLTALNTNKRDNSKKPADNTK